MLNSERLKSVEIFSLLRPEQVDKISSTAEIIKLNAGENVYQVGAKASYFYIVLHGKIGLLYTLEKNRKVLIDELSEGIIFGLCGCFNMNNYFLTARSGSEVEVLRIETKGLLSIMDEDSRIGYIIQRRISEVYFKRYIAAMHTLRDLVHDLSSN